MGSSPAKRALTFPHFPKPIAARCGARPSATQFRVVLGPGRLAQLVRASVLHTEGQRFESSIAHQPNATRQSASSWNSCQHPMRKSIRGQQSVACPESTVDLR